MQNTLSIAGKILFKVMLILFGLCILFTLITIWLPNDLSSLISNFRSTAIVFGVLTAISACTNFIIVMIR